MGTINFKDIEGDDGIFIFRSTQWQGNYEIYPRVPIDFTLYFELQYSYNNRLIIGSGNNIKTTQYANDLLSDHLLRFKVRSVPYLSFTTDQYLQYCELILNNITVGSEGSGSTGNIGVISNDRGVYIENRINEQLRLEIKGVNNTSSNIYFTPHLNNNEYALILLPEYGYYS